MLKENQGFVGLLKNGEDLICGESTPDPDLVMIYNDFCEINRVIPAYVEGPSKIRTEYGTERFQ